MKLVIVVVVCFCTNKGNEIAYYLTEMEIWNTLIWFHKTNFLGDLKFFVKVIKNRIKLLTVLKIKTVL